MHTYCLIIPCYNEELRLQKEDFLNFCKNNSNVLLVFVNDGSTDNTKDVLSSLANCLPQQIYCYNLVANKGKAEAVRQGMMYALSNFNCTYYGFFDADLATPLEELFHLSSSTQKGTYKIAIGARVKRLGAKIDRIKYRHYLGRIFSTVASLVLKIPVYDTQCGAKIFHQSLISTLFEKEFISSWLFDVEVIARFITKYGHTAACKEIIEVPLDEWVNKKGSKVKPIHFFQAFFELLSIYQTYPELKKGN